ncbi:MAG: hypothetical protein M0Z92_05975 [Actinomycetota bacterium]|nr:hypothetical protein [Actinomycetota bacterium]
MIIWEEVEVVPASTICKSLQCFGRPQIKLVNRSYQQVLVGLRHLPEIQGSEHVQQIAYPVAQWFQPRQRTRRDVAMGCHRQLAQSLKPAGAGVQENLQRYI